MNILMVAAENDAIPGGKVGGIGDVVRDIPVALAQAGHHVDVVTPGYGAFSRAPGAERAGILHVLFYGSPHTVEVFKVPGKSPRENVALWVVEHPLLAAGGTGEIYCDDTGDRPFATDATKFALFSVAVAQAIVDSTFAAIDVLHLHDWHAAMVSVLRAFDPAYGALKSIHTVYTIHNLALQGTRPLNDDVSSLRAWFPGLDYDAQLLNDPLSPHCINPMRAGINLSDKVHAVSPNYAREIQLESNPEQGFFGGEGLHRDLQRAALQGRLHGILNGCEYPGIAGPPVGALELLSLCENNLLKWLADRPVVDSVHLIASIRLARLISTWSFTKKTKNTPLILTSVGRITDQKVRLLGQTLPSGETALGHLLDVLGDRGVFIMLGSGDAGLERFLTRVGAGRENFIFLKGYSEAISRCLYSGGDLFFMPSSFEPCGTSQMLAMRAGQPCLVHGVGGLADTVRDGTDGFVFTGENLQNQAENMISCFELALKTKLEKAVTWEKVSSAAAAARFLWSDAAEEIVDKLYLTAG